MDITMLKIMTDAGSFGLVCLFFWWTLMRELPRLHANYAKSLRDMTTTFEAEMSACRLMYIEQLRRVEDKIVPCKWEPNL